MVEAIRQDDRMFRKEDIMVHIEDTQLFSVCRDGQVFCLSWNELSENERNQQMDATERYRLKQEIDKALRQHNASAVSWVTQHSQLVIRKYDRPYDASRSVIFETFIVDRADWIVQKPAIEQALAALTSKQAEE